MKISNIQPGTKLNIVLSYKGNKFETSSTVLTPYGQGLLILPVYHEGKIIEHFSDATVNIEERFSGITHQFILDSLNRVDFSGTDFQVISGREVVNNTEQRKAERFKVEREAEVSLGHKQYYKLEMHDMSLRGVSFIIKQNAGIFNIGDSLDVDFIKEDSFNHLKFSCVVKRKFKVGYNDAIGCAITTVSPSILAYIQSKKEQKHQLKDAQMFKAVI